MTNTKDSALVSYTKTVSTITAYGVITISILVLAGWIFRLSFLKNFGLGMASMDPFTAITFLLTGTSILFSQQSRTRNRPGRFIALILAFIVVVMGLFALIDHLSGWNRGFFQWFQWEPSAIASLHESSRMGPNSASILLLAGISLVLIDTRTRGGRHPALFFTALGGVLTSVALAGYVYGAPQLYAPLAYSQAISFPAVIAGMLTFLGIWLARPGSLWLSLLAGDKAGSVMARNFILPVLLVPISIDVVLMLGQYAGFYDYHLESAAHVVLTELVFIFFVIMAARSLNAAEARRFQAEAENARLAAIVATSQDAIISKNLDGAIQSWNPAAERMFGYRAEEVLGKSITLILPPEFIREEEKTLQKLALGQRIEHFETERLGRDGRRLEVSVTISPLMNAEGRVVGASKIIRDISQRKNAEARMRLLAAALQAAANAISISGSDGSIQWVNEAFTRLTGYSAEESAGLNPSVFKSGHHDAQYYQKMWETVLDKRVWQGELVNRRKDGSLYHEEMTVTPVVGRDGAITHFIAVKQDVTERKRTEARMLRQNALLEGINRIFEKAISVGTEVDLGRTCLEVAEKVTGSKFGFIGKTNDHGLEEIAISDPGWAASKMADKDGKSSPFGDFPIHGIYGRVILEGKGFFTNDPAHQPDRIGLPDGHPPLEAFLGVPLIQEGRVTGMIAVGNRDGGYTADELEALEALAPVLVEVFSHKGSETALKKAHDDLEARVQERTAALKKANETVEAERRRFKDVLDQLPAYLILLAPDYHVPFANRFFEERFGKANGRKCYEYIFNRTEPCESCETKTVLKTNAPHHWGWIGPDGRDYDIFDFPFTDADGSPLIMEVGLDITERKRADAALKALTETLERRVTERTAELVASNEEAMHLNRAMVGRELRMIELKKEVNALCVLVCQPKRYTIDFEQKLPGVSGNP